MTAKVYIALGSNLGDRNANLQAALAALRHEPGIRIEAVSRFWETQPVGGPPEQGLYLNAAAQIVTSLPARELLGILLTIEQNLGRIRTERFGPRTIDLDILLYQDKIMAEPDLCVPHPRMHERVFVLGPLAEIAPTIVHPVIGRTVTELLAYLGSQTLAGKNAVVTGSSSGIGKAIALALAEKGANVLVHARTSQAKADQVTETVGRWGRHAISVLADLRTLSGCESLVQHAYDHFESIDIWINNAGVDTLTGSGAKMSFAEKLGELFAVDVTATVLLSRMVGPRMKAAGHGVILNMGWDQAESGMEVDSGQLFAASKGAVMAFTKSLALSLAPQVRVNCLAPGWIRTAWGETASDVWQQRVLRETPLKRWGTPEDVANTACWLCSDDAAFITGQIIRVNGGGVRG